MDTAERIRCFNGGRVFEQRRYCKQHLPKVYKMLESMIKEGKGEQFISRKVLKDYCYRENEILSIVTGELNERLTGKQFSIGKRHLLRGWQVKLN